MESVTISDTEEALPPPAPQAVSAGPHASPSPQIYNFPTNFPVPAAMVCRGDIPSNWEFFKQQWQDYEVATGLDQKNQQVRLATFRSVMGKERRQSFWNLNFGPGKITISSAHKALEDYLLLSIRSSYGRNDTR